MNIQSTTLRLALGVSLLATASLASAAETKLLNASFDIARELFQSYNEAFVRHWKQQTGEGVVVNQSHAGSSKQARAVIDGLEADVVTFNQVTDVDAVAERGLISREWRKQLPNQGSPFSSTIVFLVRKGNPKGIKDWSDLVKPGVSVIVPNPKTSGNGRYSYLAAWGYALRQSAGDEGKAREFVGKLFANVPVLDTGGRGATTTFAQREIGDVLLTFEAEVFLTVKEFGADRFEAVVPSYSIEADMPVAVVQKVVAKRGTERLARAYLEYLYSDEGQGIVAANYYRPRSQKVAEQYAAQFGKLELFSVAKVFGDWASAQKTHFSEGGIFDQLYKKAK
jgi:sulfate transport system substrate-binding protein